MPSRSLTAVHSASVTGSHAMPTGLRRPDAKMRFPDPSGLNSKMAARSGGSPELTLDPDPTLTYILVPDRLKMTPRVECPPLGRGASCCGEVTARVAPGVYGMRTTASSSPT